MSEYFSYFPRTEHDLTNIGQKVEVTNILRRFIVRETVKNRTDVFYEYDMQSGDRPDTIAEKYYGNADYAWLVLHFNNIVDPVFDLPLFNVDFDNYLKGKYGSIANAQSETHEYRQILAEAIVKNDGTRIPQRYVVVDETVYNTLPFTEKELVTKYDYEVEENENKRKIKLLDKRYLNQVKSEVETIIRNGV